MTETRCVRIKLKPNSLDRVHAWADELNRRRDEVREALLFGPVTRPCYRFASRFCARFGAL
ncbi:MAG: DUF6176 family protein [Proteobacteria bacterium]|nr:DUF6176 family protein [Pseudomonadota bacterium]